MAGLAGDVERAGELQVVGVAHGLDQHAAHAPGRAGHGDAQRRSSARLPAAGKLRVGPIGSATAAGGLGGTGSALTCSSLSASGGDWREVLKVSIEATNSRSAGSSLPVSRLFSFSPSKQHHDAAQLRLGALAADREDVVPAVGVEGVGQQRRAEDVAHLGARHAGLDGSACSLVTTLPCTTSTRYGVTTPRKLSEDCSEAQPVAASAATRVHAARREREGMVALGARAGGGCNLDMIAGF